MNLDVRYALFQRVLLNIEYKINMTKYYKAVINVPRFTVDNESPFLLDISEGISEAEEQENKKSNAHVEPTVNQMTLNDDYQNYIYIANSTIYRNQYHQLNKGPMYDKNYYLQNVK